jgi:DNA polymerase-3 subunit delta'
MTWEMIGHSWAEILLSKHISAHKVRHAYLISGDDGIGKRTLAIQFARALNCTETGENGEFCGECRACSLILKGAHPDIHEIKPEKGSATIKVDQVRDLQHQLALSPYEGRWRIALVPDFERATESAANALLKTLEEPGEHVVVILTAIDAASLLPTIVSRCEVLPLRAVMSETIVKMIRTQGIPPDQAKLIAGIAQGRPGWALRLANDPEILEIRADILENLSQLLVSTRTKRFDFVEELLPRKDDLETQRATVLDVLQTWMSIWRDAMQRSFNPGVGIINFDQVELIERINQVLNGDQIHECVNALRRTQQAIERFANVRLSMEVLMLDLPYIGD